MQQAYHQDKAIHQQQARPDPDDRYIGEADPDIERIRRKLVRLMMVSIIITLLLVGAVFCIVIYRIMQPDKVQTHALHSDAPGNAYENAYEDIYAATVLKPVYRKIALPEGTRLLSESLSGSLVSLKTLRPDNSIELIIYDYRKGQIIARLQIGDESISVPAATDDMNR